MSWLLSSKNRVAIEKIIQKREKLVADITLNGKYVPDYQRKLSRYAKEVEKLYYQGLEV